MGINIRIGDFSVLIILQRRQAWVRNESPWTLDNVMLLIKEIPMGEESLNVPLWFLNI